MRTVTIIGVGRVGGALAVALSNAEYRVEHLVTTNLALTQEFASELSGDPVITDLQGLNRITSEILFVTTQDSKIAPIAARLAEIPSEAGGFAFHASGALSRKELVSLESTGWNTGSLHPLVSISDPVRGSESFKNAYFAVEGEPATLKVATSIVLALGGKSFEVETDSKTLYHAAAVVACGHLVALIETSRKMLSLCGLDEETARTVIHPLVESTVANLAEYSPGEALTGPFARADVETVQRHIQKLAEIADEDIERVYRLLGGISLEIADRHGADHDRITEIQKMILLDKSISKC